MIDNSNPREKPIIPIKQKSTWVLIVFEDVFVTKLLSCFVFSIRIKCNNNQSIETYRSILTHRQGRHLPRAPYFKGPIDY